MNSELAVLQEKLEETLQKKEKLDQFLANSKGVFRQQVFIITIINVREITSIFTRILCLYKIVILFVESSALPPPKMEISRVKNNIISFTCTCEK